jgi:hypothetical protein
MRPSVLPSLLAAAAMLSCAPTDTPVSPPEPSYSIINNKLDLDGTPDLVVREDITASQWVVRDEKLAAGLCSVEEGNVTPGVRRVIRFTVTTPNVGDADLYLGDPDVHFAANDGLYELSDCHGHYHFQHYATYELVDASTGIVWKAAKRGFCMLDTDPNPAWMGEQPREHNFLNCGFPGIPGNQGISHGWADTYRFFLGGQYFVLDGGDGQAVVPPGNYLIRITVNPPYAPPKRGGCPRVTDPATGQCHQFEESSYTNNVGVVPVTIPAHVGRDGSGPLAGAKQNSSNTSEIEGL